MIKALVVGSGAREHALVWKLAQEAQVFCTPGNPGILSECECFDVRGTDADGLVALAKRLGVDFVVIGPEDPLILGVADALRDAGVPVFGPGRAGAQLEGSKAFSKALMEEAGIPTAKHQSYTVAEEAHEDVRRRWAEGKRAVIKASGAALGKGVVVCQQEYEAHAAIEAMMVAKEFGDAGSTVVVEDLLEGREFSLLTLCNGSDFKSLPLAQDYKRIFDNDEGPNTGGMGSYSPLEWLTDEDVSHTERTVVAPLLKALKDKGIDYRGTLFSGLMKTADGIYCLEYNVRFGDPETQSVMMRLGNGFADALEACATGRSIPEFEVKGNFVVSVVLASGGYPGAVKKGVPITIGALPAGAKCFHAGTAFEGGSLVTAGGRVVTVTAVAATASEARALAYEGAGQVSFEGKQIRNDISGSASSLIGS